MDPNANLKEQDYLLTAGVGLYDGERLEELRVALRRWIRQGGFEPNWDDYPVANYEFRLWAKEMR